MAIPLSAQYKFGPPNAVFENAETARQLTSGQTLALTLGVHLIVTSANDIVEYSPDAGVTWRTRLAASAVDEITSDGFNVRFRNTGTADSGGVFTYDTLIGAANN